MPIKELLRGRVSGTLALCLLLWAAAPPSSGARSRGIGVAKVAASWLRLDPAQPRTVYIGGDTWAERSDDAGATWRYIVGFVPAPIDMYGLNSSSLAAPVVSASGAHVYGSATDPERENPVLLSSLDGGGTWKTLNGTAESVANMLPSVSPLRDTRVYALELDHSDPAGPGSIALGVSDDAGRTWRSSAAIGSWHYPSQGQYPALPPVPDPRDLATVYVDGDTWVARSEDSGVTWTTVATPTAGLATFSVQADPHLPGLLEAAAPGSGARRWLSADHGRTWRVGSCAGVSGGACPSFTVDNALGAGRSYAFLPDGVHAFAGGGASGPRLGLSDRLPVPVAALRAVQAGSSWGDPIYLLSTNGAAPVGSTLYRSTDGGLTWRSLAGWLPPTLLPAAPGPDGAYVAPTRHRVAAPFLDMYRRLGPVVLGYPIDEAYAPGHPLRDIYYLGNGASSSYPAAAFSAGATLVQDFQHMRLELRGVGVRIAPLGSVVGAFPTAYRSTPPDPDLGSSELSPVASVADTPSLRYFPTTRHTLRGALLRYWQAHGGLAVLGAPISEVYTSQNSDGSGVAYRMQLFQNARLELHPEARDPRDAVLFGLLGDEALEPLGWVE